MRQRLRSDYPTTVGGTLSPRSTQDDVVTAGCSRFDFALGLVGLVGLVFGLYYLLAGSGFALTRGVPAVERPILHGWPEDLQSYEESGDANDPNLLTALVKTLDRPHHLYRLLSSLREFYPRLPVYVGVVGVVHLVD
jgi:hypothetical protein